MATAKRKQAGVSVIILNQQDRAERPHSEPSLSELKTLGSYYNLGITPIKERRLNQFGFTLDASSPTAANKAGLIVPLNRDVNVNAWYPPYYYQFIQRTMNDVWFGTSHAQGKVTIRFAPDYRIDNGVIFLRVGGNHGYFIIGGTGYFIKVGNGPRRFVAITPTNPKPDGNYDFVSQTIPVILFTPENTRRLGSLPDIEITSDLPVWKFFSAGYNPFTIVQK